MYRKSTAQLAIGPLILIGVMCQNAVADEPGASELSLRYSIREAPNVPASPVVWTIELRLCAQLTDGDHVGWLVHDIRISSLDVSGQPSGVWTEDTPITGTPDGLWWIEHVDPQHPDPSEFTKPPFLEGEAVAEDPMDTNLDYTIQGAVLTVPPEGLPFECTGALDYTFKLVGSTEPQALGRCKPVELPDPVEYPPVG